MAMGLLQSALICLLAGLAGCSTRKTEAHREWSEQRSHLRGLILRHGDSLSPAADFWVMTNLGERELNSLADTTEAWDLDTAGIRIEIPSADNIAPFSFTIRSHRLPAIGDSLRFQLAGGGETDPDPPRVSISRLERNAGAPMLVAVSPESLSLVLVGIPFDSTFIPVLPKRSRIMARKAARFRIDFDGRLLEGESQSVEYRYASTTLAEERDGL